MWQSGRPVSSSWTSTPPRPRTPTRRSTRWGTTNYVSLWRSSSARSSPPTPTHPETRREPGIPLTRPPLGNPGAQLCSLVPDQTPAGRVGRRAGRAALNAPRSHSKAASTDVARPDPPLLGQTNSSYSQSCPVDIAVYERIIGIRQCAVGSRSILRRTVANPRLFAQRRLCADRATLRIPTAGWFRLQSTRSPGPSFVRRSASPRRSGRHPHPGKIRSGGGGARTPRR